MTPQDTDWKLGLRHRFTKAHGVGLRFADTVGEDICILALQLVVARESNGIDAIYICGDSTVWIRAVNDSITKREDGMDPPTDSVNASTKGSLRLAYCPGRKSR